MDQIALFPRVRTRAGASWAALYHWQTRIERCCAQLGRTQTILRQTIARPPEIGWTDERFTDPLAKDVYAGIPMITLILSGGLAAAGASALNQYLEQDSSRRCTRQKRQI